MGLQEHVARLRGVGRVAGPSVLGTKGATEAPSSPRTKFLVGVCLGQGTAVELRCSAAGLAEHEHLPLQVTVLQTVSAKGL